MELGRSDVVLASEQTSAGAARAFVATRLADISRAPLDIVVLLTSELVTNAIRHGSGPIRLHVSWDDHGVRVGVADDSPQRPVLRARDRDAPNGRGLQLVDALASAWGAESEATGKTVWFHLAW